MASTLDERILERLRGLDDAQKQRLLDFMDEEFEAPAFSIDDWLRDVEAFEAKLLAENGQNFSMDAASLIEEIREERLDDILGRA